MLIAEVTNGEATAIGIVSAVVAGLPGLGAWLLTAMKSRKEAKGKDRADAILEWKDYVARQEADITRLQGRCDEQDRRMFSLQESERDCMRQFADAKEKIATQNGVIGQLTADVRRLQAITHDTHPGVTMPVIVIAGMDGVIVDVTTACGPMLHWLPDELRGQSVEVLIPPRLLGEHRAALANVAEGRRQVDPGRAIMAQAMRRDGSEVNVTINLSQWRSPMGSEFLTAEIREQPSAGDRAARE